MPGVGRAATLAATPTERSWRRVSSLIIVGSKPCSVAPVASGGRGALRPAHVVVFRALILAAESARADRLVYFWCEPLKWHAKLGTVSGKGCTRGRKDIRPESSGNGCRT